MNNKKVLLVTIQDNNNIGNRLQNYALQSVLERMNLEVVNLDNSHSKISLELKLKKLVKFFLSIIRIKKYKNFIFLEGQKRKRYIVNKKFSGKYIHNFVKVTYDSVFKKDWSTYSIGFVGSDQVWHKWRKETKELPYYYLEFLPKGKRVAYAASFGFDKFPLNDEEQHVEGLQGMKYISCREKTGCKLVESVRGGKVPHVLDPTLLLSSDDWLKLSLDSNSYSKSQKNYVFIYFLGELPNEYKKEIQKISEKENLKVIDYLDLYNDEIAKCGPKEFISLIANASYVLTDSFHCCVFSLLFERRFKAFRRKGKGMEKMFSRIEELLVNTGNSDKIYGGVDHEVISEDFEELRQASLDYIKKVINDAI